RTFSAERARQVGMHFAAQRWVQHVEFEPPAIIKVDTNGLIRLLEAFGSDSRNRNAGCCKGVRLLFIKRAAGGKDRQTVGIGSEKKRFSRGCWKSAVNGHRFIGWLVSVTHR